MEMRATRTNAYTDRREPRLKRMSFEQRAELRKRYFADVPLWRRAPIGYIAAFPLIGLTVLGTLFVQRFLAGHFYFAGSLCILAVLFIALLWGGGPSLVAVILSTFVLDYFVLPSAGYTDFTNWQGFVQLIPFVISGLTIAIITSQRERARLNALAAEQELQSYADELEVINQKLEDADQMKDRFLSIASHELKTPITTIRGQAQLALRRISKQKESSSQMDGLRTTLEKIDDQTTRLTSLVNELLDVSRMRAGKTELHKKPCDLREICREVVDDQQLLTGRTIVLEAAPSSVELQIDKDRFSQVLVNLISNAVKYSPEESPVEICVGSNGCHVIVEVQDHGRGIAKDQQELIFDTFYRTPDAQASSKQGLGLGLAISKDIVERHGGRIWCESEPEQGSKFTIELPVH
ncbi:sensor histidine kinase [Ktedonosporobacter rubrisoli]|nr:HAMP domain-containing sensor histidine kinase [Ktedonosporobacter rubrisoli]